MCMPEKKKIELPKTRFLIVNTEGISYKLNAMRIGMHTILKLSDSKLMRPWSLSKYASIFMPNFS